MARPTRTTNTARSSSPFTAAGLALPLVVVNCGVKPPSAGEAEQTGGEAGVTTAGDDALPCIAPAIAQSCPLVGCHDAITREHGMDLSSGSSIYAAWIDRTGFDHCRHGAEQRRPSRSESRP